VHELISRAAEFRKKWDLADGLSLPLFRCSHMLLALQLSSARKPIVEETTTSIRITMEPPQPESQEVLVHRSSTRRKACTRCVKAKRRCNLTLPACSRCRTRSLDCIYVRSSRCLWLISLIIHNRLMQPTQRQALL
jgi:hypothetical protein